MKRKTRNRIYSAVLCVLIFATASLMGIAVGARTNEPPLISPALAVIAEQNGMAMAGLIGEQISFEADDFARALNLSSVGGVVITKAPDVSEGELRVGTAVVSSGQRISRESLSLMTFTAASEDSVRASFRFRLDNGGYDIPCSLYFLKTANSAPSLSSVPEAALSVSTHRNITYYGMLPCYDPEGDETIIEIVRYPESGLLHLKDRSTGEYTYTPTAGYSGRDSFTYVARDIYGNYSASAEVSLSVVRPKTSVTFDDMSDSPYYNAALTMLEEGIMSGTQVGADVYFYPEDELSRGEFVVMAMYAIGITDVATASSSPFVDDDDIPELIKDHVCAAYELGFINGIATEAGLCFEPNRTITRAEAAVILGNMLDVSAPTVLPVFADSADVPAWAAPSLYSLSSVGVVSTLDGHISPSLAVTRADAAQMLTNVMFYLEG